MQTENDHICCDCCGEHLTGVEQLNIDKRRALIALHNQAMALASMDMDAARRYNREARKHLTSHQA